MKYFLFALLNTLLLVSCRQSSEEVHPVTKPLIEAVYASGYVVSRGEYEVVAQAEGYVTAKLVAEGDVVKKGDPLYILDADQQNARDRIASETYNLAVKNFRDDSPVMRELKAAVESAQTKLRYDSLNFSRYTNLLKNNATTRAEFDRIKLIYENSSNDLTLARSRYENTRNQLYLELQNASNNLRISQDEAGRYVVRSEVDGVVFMMSKDKGELVRRAEVIAIVGQKDAFYIELSVDEMDVHRVRAGQEALVKVDAYPDQTFNAKISKVYPLVDRKLQSVRVDAELIDPLPAGFSGLALEANIIIQRKENAVVIPKASLLPGDSVMIRTENGSQKIKVLKGIETLDEVEIVRGLDTTSLLVSQ